MTVFNTYMQEPSHDKINAEGHRLSSDEDDSKALQLQVGGCERVKDIAHSNIRVALRLTGDLFSGSY